MCRCPRSCAPFAHLLCTTCARSLAPATASSVVRLQRAASRSQRATSRSTGRLWHHQIAMRLRFCLSLPPLTANVVARAWTRTTPRSSSTVRTPSRHLVSLCPRRRVRPPSTEALLPVATPFASPGWQSCSLAGKVASCASRPPPPLSLPPLPPAPPLGTTGTMRARCHHCWPYRKVWSPSRR